MELAINLLDDEIPLNRLCLGVPRETYPQERRVSLVPSVVKQLVKQGWNIVVERGAGESAGFPDHEYVEAGATLVSAADELWDQAQIVVAVRIAGADPMHFPQVHSRLKSRHLVIGMCNPLEHVEEMQQLAATQANCFALELLPRISRAQAMDVLSSQANLAGYKATIMAASLSPRIFPMLMTAAGTLTAARVFVLGAGVAGLQAIATARRLGATVKAYDVRPAAKDEVQSLGARFVELNLESAEGSGGYARAMDEEYYRRQREALMPTLTESDVVITTAAVPGKRAPLLITREMVEVMPPGSILIDLAAEQGGNCELTHPGDMVVHHGVTIVGAANLPATVPFHASQAYARNIQAFLQLMVTRRGTWRVNLEDELLQNTLVACRGKIVHPQLLRIAGSSLEPETPPQSPMSGS